MREVIPTPVPGLDLRREYGHHQSPAIRAGGMVFCSGMVAIDPQSGERQHGTVTSEARRIFENLKLLLESTGLSLDRSMSILGSPPPSGDPALYNPRAGPIGRFTAQPSRAPR